MKKILSILLALSIIFAMSLTVFADTDSDEPFPRLTDRADLLSESEEEQILKNLNDLSDYHGVDICIRTSNGTKGMDIQDYADDFYKRHYGENGVLLVVNIRDREMYITTAGKGIKAFTDYGIDEVLDLVAPYFTDMMYMEGFTEFCTQSDRLFTLYEQGTPLDVEKDPPAEKHFDFAKILLVSIFIGFGIGLIIVSAQKSTLKSVRKKYAAAEYRDEGSFFLTDSRDMFLYHTVNRIPKPKMDNNNMSGGMMGGSTTHMSGGMEFGGGGRSF